ncbi:MAG: MFS transporter [Patulibacter sp.]|nr:MFS transporter [Patulibacter sp.]
MWLLVAAIVLVALNQRAPIVTVGPLLDQIRAGTGLSGSGAGVLTMLPVLCFGALAPLAPRLARRYGATTVVGAAMVVLALGLALRSVPALTALFAGTVVVGGAVAVSNVLMPSIVKRDFATRAGLVLGLYAMALSVGAAVAAGVTVPVQDALAAGWRPTLALWLVPAIAAVGLWVLATRGATATAAGPAIEVLPPRRVSLWRDPVAWSVTAFLGFGSIQFYASFAWFPTILVDHGIGEQAAGWLLALMGVTGAVSSMVVPVLATRSRGQGRFVVGIVALYVVSWGGMLTAATAAPALWACLMGVAQGAAISLALTLMVIRARDERRAAELSGMAQTVGYLLAATGPLMLGAVHDLTGGWTVPMVGMVVVLAPMLVAGLAAGRPRLVGATYDPAHG